jgi:hypothetical protein
MKTHLSATHVAYLAAAARVELTHAVSGLTRLHSLSTWGGTRNVLLGSQIRLGASEH